MRASCSLKTSPHYRDSQRIDIIQSHLVLLSCVGIRCILLFVWLVQTQYKRSHTNPHCRMWRGKKCAMWQSKPRSWSGSPMCYRNTYGAKLVAHRLVLTAQAILIAICRIPESIKKLCNRAMDYPQQRPHGERVRNTIIVQIRGIFVIIHYLILAFAQLKVGREGIEPPLSPQKGAVLSIRRTTHYKINCHGRIRTYN